MGTKPVRYRTCICCGDRIGCRSHKHCKQLCLVGLCEGCATGDCIDENLRDIDDELATAKRLYLDVSKRLNKRHAELHAARIRAAAWRKKKMKERSCKK